LKTLTARLCFVGFKFCQPPLINRVVATLSSKSSESSSDKLLVVAAALVYIGLATCNSIYTTQLNRTMTMTRGTLVSSIFGHTIYSCDSFAGDKSPLTLMTTDVQRITTTLGRAIDGLASAPVEITIGMVLLSRQIGWVCVLPIIISSAAVVWGIRNSGSAVPLQRAWVSATQERISLTAGVLGIPKAMKMLGLTDVFRTKILNYRSREVERCKAMLRFGTLRSIVGMCDCSHFNLC